MTRAQRTGKRCDNTKFWPITNQKILLSSIVSCIEDRWLCYKTKLFCTKGCIGGGERDIVNSLRPARERGGMVSGMKWIYFPPLNTHPHTQRSTFIAAVLCNYASSPPPPPINIPYKWGGIGRGALPASPLPININTHTAAGHVWYLKFSRDTRNSQSDQ